MRGLWRIWPTKPPRWAKIEPAAHVGRIGTGRPARGVQHVPLSSCGLVGGPSWDEPCMDDQLAGGADHPKRARRVCAGRLVYIRLIERAQLSLERGAVRLDKGLR